jgi:hypothetical protein
VELGGKRIQRRRSFRKLKISTVVFREFFLRERPSEAAFRNWNWLAPCKDIQEAEED